jgi:hypothetical protein
VTARAAFIDERLNGLAGEWRRAAARLRARDPYEGGEAADAYADCADRIDAVLIGALDLDDPGGGCPAGPGHLAAARWHLTELDVECRRHSRKPARNRR